MQDASPTPSVGGAPSQSEERHARLVTSLHRLTLAEFQSLVSPVQQRALIDRYEGLSDSSKLSALRRVKDTLDIAVDDLAVKRQATMLDGGNAQGSQTRQSDELDERVQDHALTLQHLAAEARLLEQNCSRKPQRPAPQVVPAKPVLSQLFNREMERAKAGRGGGSHPRSSYPGSSYPGAGSSYR
mmetsp:Transcript_30742/g.65424  ORF Transcript_30742/g.65424 Transcript_30742/m.65424 type:complete len:185 (+) Transcript_30742:39-593(+)